MKNFSSILASSPLIEIALFLRALPQETVNQLIEHTDITISNLESYIADHMIVSDTNERNPLIAVDN